MSPTEEKGGVGRVETRYLALALPPEGLRLECGRSLPEVTVAYETYGRLAPRRDNVVFLCHALSGSAHAAGFHEPPDDTPPWWDAMIGPGRGIDTDYYYVVCANILGGCKGTTGPASLNPATGRPYGSAFPPISVGDIVNVHCLLLRQLGIERLAAVIGGSFGGMQALDWAIRYPEMIERCICIASASSLSAQALAFDIVGRNAITSDPDWQGGDYYGTSRQPAAGLSLARKIGHITYLSPEMMAEKFGRDRRAAPAGDALESLAARFLSTFQVESYLDHQGEKFVGRFDANSYLQITRAMDEFSLEERYGTLERAFAPIRARLLVVALSADWLFPPEQSRQIANALLRAGKNVSFCLLSAPHGHDAFLLDIVHLPEVIRAFLPWVGEAAPAAGAPAPPAAPSRRGRRGPAPDAPDADRRQEFDAILDMIRPGARVLDLGCGGGDLLSELARQRGASGLGVDIEIQHVIDVLDRGHNIFQGDIDAGLEMIPDRSYDYAILSETLQEVRKPLVVLREMLRVARKGIVSFPNFGEWVHRRHLCLTGRMPKGGALPFEWYETPNIHLFTLNDFMDVCRTERFQILKIVCLPGGRISRLLLALGLRNLGASRVLVKIARVDSELPAGANENLNPGRNA